jgi:uncharacterized membrane protein YjjP (DUF1212 family)
MKQKFTLIILTTLTLLSCQDKASKMTTENNSEDKKIDLQKLLASDDINNSIIELDNFICELCAWGDSLDKLTEQQKNFYFNQITNKRQ